MSVALLERNQRLRFMDSSILPLAAMALETAANCPRARSLARPFGYPRSGEGRPQGISSEEKVSQEEVSTKWFGGRATRRDRCARIRSKTIACDAIEGGSGENRGEYDSLNIVWLANLLYR